MGHERLGVWPKTTRWKAIIDQLEILYDSEECSSVDIAQQVLKNVRTQYEKLGKDKTVETVLSEIIKLSHAYSYTDFKDRLGELKPDDSSSPTVLSIIQAIKETIPETEVNSEYTQLALRATSDALIEWTTEHASSQIDLFQPTNESNLYWKELGTGAGFCELTKSFFANLTERYLHYFLDREVANYLSFNERERFDEELEKYIKDISQHAFETSKITQSFSAGWFNKYARESLPNKKLTRRFIDKTFKKLQEELLREQSK